MGDLTTTNELDAIVPGPNADVGGADHPVCGPREKDGDAEWWPNATAAARKHELEVPGALAGPDARFSLVGKVQPVVPIPISTRWQLGAPVVVLPMDVGVAVADPGVLMSKALTVRKQTMSALVSGAPNVVHSDVRGTLEDQAPPCLAPSRCVSVLTA